MPSSQQDTGIIAGINVTPLVDVMLVLLVIFIVTAKIIVTPAVPLDLPKAAKTEEVQVVFSVIVPERGAVTVDGQPVPDDVSLAAQARSAVGRDADLRAVIQADGGVPHRRVVAILDALRGAGVAHIAFGVLPEEAAAAAR
ncbi:MAG TPA: biopolymer transporter ExbD [Polyangia bacterium]|nr:biopolymer transporter ExbD [Polyangia bacterium]